MNKNYEISNTQRCIPARRKFLNRRNVGARSLFGYFLKVTAKKILVDRNA